MMIKKNAEINVMKMVIHIHIMKVEQIYVLVIAILVMPKNSEQMMAMFAIHHVLKFLEVNIFMNLIIYAINQFLKFPKVHVSIII